MNYVAEDPNDADPHARRTAVAWGPEHMDVFARARNGSLLHWVWDEGHGLAGPHNLGGSLASAPVAVRSGQRLEVFARGRNHRLLHWSGDGATFAMVEHSGWLASDPVAVAWGDNRVDVFATSLDGPLRHWWSYGTDWWGPATLGGMLSSPVSVASPQHARLDVFARGNGGGLEHGTLVQTDGPSYDFAWGPSRGGALDSRPIAVSTGYRLDVLARGATVVGGSGGALHWGWKGEWDSWYGPEPAPDLDPAALSDDTVAVSAGPDRIDLFSRGDQDLLEHWEWQASGRYWARKTHEEGPILFCPPVPMAADQRIDVISTSSLGSVLHWWSDRDLEPPDEVVPVPGAAWHDNEELPVAVSTGPVWAPPAPPAPTVLAVRPRDLVVLGVRWSGFQAQPAAAGEPSVIRATGDDARIVLTFPPQHVAEEVATGDPPYQPTLDPAATAGYAVWRADLSGTSQLAFTVAAETQVVLSVEGVLAALAQGTIVDGRADAGVDGTAIELPWRLVTAPEVAPDRTDGADPRVRSENAATPVELSSGAVGLWRSRLSASHPDRRAAAAASEGARNAHVDDAGLALRTLSAGSGDPFPMPLPDWARATILAQGTPAGLRRLELSTLGGSLSARGLWASFAWDHDATLGRDMRVRTLQKGVLFPFGHRAEWQEVTERIFDPSAPDPVAVLHKTYTLTVTEPVVYQAHDDPLAPVFPFSEVEITTRLFTGLGAANFVTHPRPPRDLADLESLRERYHQTLPDLAGAVHGDMGYGGLGPTVEELADDMSEAAEYIEGLAALAQVEADIAALAGVVGEEVPVHFWPVTRDGQKVAFPVRLAGRDSDLHVRLPLLFVSDHDLLQTETSTAFDSLSDPEIVERVRSAYAAEGAGVVEVSATLDLVRADTRHDSDLQEVRRLNLVGVTRERGFRARLGPPPEGRPEVPDETTWGFEVTLPAVQALLGDGVADRNRAPVPMRYAETFEQAVAAARGVVDEAGAAADVAFALANRVESIALDFTEQADRAGGLAAPVIDITGVSREHGLANVDALVNRIGNALDPSQVLGQGATLLGYDLTQLINPELLEKPPAIVSSLAEAALPSVTLTWQSVALRPFESFLPRPDGTTLDIVVEQSPTKSLTSCTVSAFDLALPTPEDRLVTLGFSSLQFVQEATQPPRLEVGDVTATFEGILDLLKELQEAVDLGPAAPAIAVTPSGLTARYAIPIPEVSAGAFVMRNLTFHALVDVPFDGRSMSVSLGFASRENPFNLSILMFGGGGYVDVGLDRNGITRFEISLEFGAAVAVNFLVAEGEVHALGGVRYEQAGGRVQVTGFIRFGGSVDILGLVSVSVELVVSLRYDGARMVGRATLIVEIDLTLISTSVELDSGDWELIGGESVRELRDAPDPVVATEGPSLDDWRAYRDAFAEVTR